MLQPSKVTRSREEWKKKATQRADEIRELKKTKKRQKKNIAVLKAQNKTLAESLEHDKKNG